MRIIADSSQMQPGNQALYVMPDSPYKTVQELVRHHVKVGVKTAEQRRLGDAGLAARSERGQAELGNAGAGGPPLPQLLAQHKIPAAWLPEPFGTEAEQEYGAVPLADFDQGSLRTSRSAPSSALLRGCSRTPTRSRRSCAPTTRVSRSRTATGRAVEQALVVHTGVKQEIAATMSLDTYPLVMDVPVMQRVPDAMYEFGVISKQYNIPT